MGQENLAIRLSPFGLFNQTRDEQRVETWGHLCRELKKSLPTLSYVSFIEPRYEQILSEEKKQGFLDSWGLHDVDLSEFRRIFTDTPFLSGGGWNDQSAWGEVESGKYDGLLFSRFISNPDLVERLREGRLLTQMMSRCHWKPLLRTRIMETQRMLEGPRNENIIPVRTERRNMSR